MFISYLLLNTLISTHVEYEVMASIKEQHICKMKNANITVNFKL